MTTRIYLGRVASVALLLSAALVPSASGQAADARWVPFIGCWEPLDAGAEAGLLCFRPAGQGVEMFNVVDGQTASTELLSADGTPRAVSAEGCTGFESARFSEDGFRVFTSSEFTCGDEIRAGSGVMAFLEQDRWIDVRSLQVNGQPVAWAQGYGLAAPDDLAAQGVADPADYDRTLVRAMRIRAARAIDVADVEEAVAHVHARAVEVWVAAQEDELDLSGAELVRLADAGISEGVIDVMVAVSYPDRFVLTPEGDAAAAERDTRDLYATGYRRGFGSYLWDPYYRPIGFGYSRYSPFGYYGYGLDPYYGGYYGYRPIAVAVQPATPGGRMVPGVGYTRGSSSATSGSGSATPRSSAAPARASSRGDGRSSSSDGGSTSRSGSGASTGRTARPRN